MAKKPENKVEIVAEQTAPVTAVAERAAPVTAVAVVAAKPLSLSGFKVTKRVTMPTVNPGVNEPRIFRIEDAMRVSDYKNPDSQKAQEKPATICTVTDMTTGECLTWLVGEVCVKNLERHYPNATYVGKIFGVQKLPKRAGKRYFDFEIMELEVE